jgi:hypothetical protein
MASAASDTEFRRNERVVALQDLPGIPAGTPGKVELVNGLTWIRYRVAFENGVDRGSIDSAYLARPDDFDRRRAELAAAAERAAAAAEATDEGAGDVAADAGDGKVVNGVKVPARLLEMSKRARERLAS